MTSAKWNVAWALCLVLIQTPRLEAQEPPDAAPGAGPAKRYVSSGPLEPDRLASAWLIQRHVDPGARVELLPADEEKPADAIPFDEPGAEWSRNATRSAYETILLTEGLEDPALRRIGALVRASELAYWALKPGSAAERFDAILKDFSIANDVAGAFAYLDRVYRAGGVVPERGD